MTASILFYFDAPSSMNLETNVVSERLGDLGLDTDEIQTRLGRLSDWQLHKTALEFILILGNGLASRIPESNQDAADKTIAQRTKH